MSKQRRTLATGFHQVSSDFKKDIGNNTKNNIKNDINKDIKNEMLNNIENNIKKDTEKEIENNIKNDIENNTQNNIENDSENNIKNESENEIKINSNKLDELLSGKKKEKNKPTLLHLEPEVVKVLDRLSGVKKGRSGLKSQIVNEILKEVFRSKGLMK